MKRNFSYRVSDAATIPPNGQNKFNCGGNMDTNPRCLPWILLVGTVMVLVHIQAYGQSSYGLTCASPEACVVLDNKASVRMATAKTICSSGDSAVSYRKGSKPDAAEMNRHWRSINSAEFIAKQGYRIVLDCTNADLVVKTTVSVLDDSVSLEVTDADSGEPVFIESRSIHDESSDLARIARHFHDDALAAKAAQQQLEREAADAERVREAQARHEEDLRKCREEYDSISDNVIAIARVQHHDLPPAVLSQIEDHNNRCPSVQVNQRQILDDADARERERLAHEAAERTEAEQRAADAKREETFKKLQVQALASIQARIANVPYIPPADGNAWVESRSGPSQSSTYYIVPPNGNIGDCSFAVTGKKEPHALYALNCIRERNSYFAVIVNDRMYAVKSDRVWPDARYAGQVKDHGKTICLRGAGCHTVLAELRLAPSVLPDKPEVPLPSASMAGYRGMGISFLYPANWNVTEKKADGAVSSLSVAPPEAKFDSWSTHGFVVAHLNKMELDLEVDQVFTRIVDSLRLNTGLLIADKPDPISVGGRAGLIARYDAPSPFAGGERGLLVVVKDNSDGWFRFLFFEPGTEAVAPYAQTFEKILQSVRFDEIK